MQSWRRASRRRLVPRVIDAVLWNRSSGPVIDYVCSALLRYISHWSIHNLGFITPRKCTKYDQPLKLEEVPTPLQGPCITIMLPNAWLYPRMRSDRAGRSYWWVLYRAFLQLKFIAPAEDRPWYSIRMAVVSDIAPFAPYYITANIDLIIGSGGQ